MKQDKEMSLGEFLRHEREKKGITIEQVASATKVGVRSLHSLEADHYIELPAKPFIRGFVTSYCRFIGLDSKEVLANYDDFITKKAAERPNRESGHSGYVFEKKDGEQQSRTILLVAIFGFVLVGGLAVVVLKPSLHHHRSSQIDRLRAAHSSQEAPAASVPGEAVLAANGTGPAVPLISDPAQTHLVPAALTPEVKLPPAPVSAPAPEKNSNLNSVKTQEVPATTKKAAVPAAPIPAPVAPNSNPPQPASLPTTGAAPGPNAAPAADAPVQKAGANPADPLDSGHTLSTSEIRHKVIFKALADIWVRYQADQRPERKFIVRKGRTLVLRATEKISFQVSNPSAVTFNYNSQGSKLFSAFHKTALKNGIQTLFFPTASGTTVDKPFEDISPLPKTPDPDHDDSVSVP